jgi:hypothetical protein
MLPSSYIIFSSRHSMPYGYLHADAVKEVAEPPIVLRSVDVILWEIGVMAPSAVLHAYYRTGAVGYEGHLKWSAIEVLYSVLGYILTQAHIMSQSSRPNALTIRTRTKQRSAFDITAVVRNATSTARRAVPRLGTLEAIVPGVARLSPARWIHRPGVGCPEEVWGQD